MIAVFKYLKTTPRKRGLSLFLAVSRDRMRGSVFFPISSSSQKYLLRNRPQRAQAGSKETRWFWSQCGPRKRVKSHPKVEGRGVRSAYATRRYRTPV